MKKGYFFRGINKKYFILTVLTGAMLVLSGCSKEEKPVVVQLNNSSSIETVGEVKSAYLVSNLNDTKEENEVTNEDVLEVPDVTVSDDGEEYVVEDSTVSQEPIYKKVAVSNGTGVNVRSEPDKDNDGNKLGSVNIGDTLDFVCDLYNGWYQVIYKGQTAYVYAKYFDIQEQLVEDNIQDVEEVQTPVEQEVKIVRANSSVRVRRSNSAQSEKLGDLYYGDVLEYIETTVNNWYKVKYKGGIGYVCGDYADVDIEGIHRAVVPVVTAKSELNVRNEPSTAGTIVHVLYDGDSLQYTQRLSNGWYQVLLDGHPAYVSGKYVKEGSKEMITSVVHGIVAMNGDNYIYSDRECKNAVACIPGLALCKMYSAGEKYYLIDSEYGSGYIKKNSAEYMGDLSVAVDVTSQLGKVFRKGASIKAFPVVTGHEIDSPTPEGILRIKEEDVSGTMSGKPVAYPMRLCKKNGKSVGAIYIHGANKWRKKYGGKIYKKNGSHGCINTDDDDAKFIYDQYMPIGDPDPRTGYARPLVLVYRSNNGFFIH